MTRHLGVPIVIRTADCLPVFIFDQKQRVIGLVHAGWRGSHKRILGSAIERMNNLWDTQVQDIKIVFGQSIKSCCYQVGEEFRGYFPGEIRKKESGLYLDLTLVNGHQALECGVRQENIFDSGICTCCDTRFFSYRREGERAGRMISLMMLK